MGEVTQGDLPVVVVLGAGSGGRGVAGALTGAAHLVVVDRSAELAESVSADVASEGGSAETAVVDLVDLPAVEAFRDDLLARHRRIDAVVHLVGGWQGSATVDADAIRQWDALLPGIVTTVQTTTVAFREDLAAAAAGRYVMVTSTAAAKPTKGNAAYAATKSAAAAWVRALDDAFSGTPARAHVVAVKALVDAATRAANPDKTYAGFTDTAELGTAIAGIILGADPDVGTDLDLTAGRR